MTKIVVLFPEFLGDFIMLSPAIHHLKDEYPDSQIDIYTSTFLCKLAIHHPAIDNAYELPDLYTDGREDKKKIKDFGRALKGEGYSIGYFMEDFLFWVLWHGKVKIKIHEQSNPLFKLCCVGTGGQDRRDNLRHLAQRHMDNVCALTKKTLTFDDYNFHLDIPEDKMACDLQPKEPYVYVNVDGKSAKKYETAFFHRVIEWLLQQGKTIVVDGLRDSFDCGTAFAGRDGFIYTVGKTDLYQMFGLIKNAAWLVSNDSGPSHVACMLSKPSLIFFPAKGNKPNLTGGFYKNNRTYKSSPFVSKCELNCHSYSLCKEEFCETDYDWERVETQLKNLFKEPNRSWEDKEAETLKASLNIMIYPLGLPNDQVEEVRAQLKKAVLRYKDEGVFIELANEALNTTVLSKHNTKKALTDWTFSDMLWQIQLHSLNVIYVPARSLPFKLKLWNWWFRFSERAYIVFVAAPELKEDVNEQLRLFASRLRS